MPKQEVMIQYNNTEVFFFAHNFKSAYEHADEFVERNRGKFEMKLYLLNTSSFGGKWTHYETHPALPTKGIEPERG